MWLALWGATCCFRYGGIVLWLAACSMFLHYGYSVLIGMTVWLIGSVVNIMCIIHIMCTVRVMCVILCGDCCYGDCLGVVIHLGVGIVLLHVIYYSDMVYGG